MRLSVADQDWVGRRLRQWRTGRRRKSRPGRASRKTSGLGTGDPRTSWSFTLVNWSRDSEAARVPSAELRTILLPALEPRSRPVCLKRVGREEVAAVLRSRLCAPRQVLPPPLGAAPRHAARNARSPCCRPYRVSEPKDSCFPRPLRHGYRPSACASAPGLRCAFPSA